MLFIGKTQVNHAEFAKKLDIPLETIRKKPVFEVAQNRKKKDRANGGVIKTPAGHTFGATFQARFKDGSVETVRYAETHRPTEVGDRVIDKYEPYNVSFSGEAMMLPESELDKALYLYAHPLNKQSPFYNSDMGYRHEYIDDVGRAEARMKEMDSLTKALDDVRSHNEEELRILAKGLKMAGIDIKNKTEVLLDVLEYAKNNPKEYLDHSNSQITMIRGKILNFADKNIFELSETNGVRQWKWKSGPKKDELIVDTMNQTVDARELLTNHVLSNLQDYLYLLNNMTSKLTAEESAARYLQEQNPEPTIDPDMVGDNLPDHLKSESTVDMSNYALPTTFQEALDYLTKKEGKRPSNSAASKFLKEVQENQPV